MKILFFNRWVGVHSGGTETHLLELAKRLSGLGHQVSILTREGQRLGELGDAIRVIRVSRTFRESDHSYDDFRVYFYTLIYMIKSFLILLRLKLKGERFDLLSVHFTVEAIIARLYRVLTGTPFIFVLEGYTPLEARTASLADERIAISHFEAGVYKKRHGLESKVLYVGVDTDRFSIDKQKGQVIRKRLGLEANEILILSVCRLEPRKDLFTLIEGARLLKEKGKRIKFLIVGDGILRKEVAEAIKAKGLEDYVLVAGFIPDRQLPLYYAAADIFLLTSKEEWFGIVFLEAMAAGLPVIATDTDACPEVVDGCGLFFKKSDPYDLSVKIDQICDNRRLRDELSGRSRVRAKDFDWKKRILAYQEAYKRVLKR